MQRWKNIFFNIALGLNCLLLFLLIFESRLSVPVWLQVAGRMHPLILHFPVTLVILYALVTILTPTKTFENKTIRDAADALLLFAAVSSVLTALVGLFLSREAGYDPEALLWHKWGGTTVSIFTLAWYYFRNSLRSAKLVTWFASALGVLLIIFAGHQGAGITHGQNFLLAPMLPEKHERIVSPEEAIVFADMVKPIIEAKCISCHNSNKAKGDLVMETQALLLKGGKNGKLWDPTLPDLGLLMQRLHLPIEQKKHMPPQGKTQLTEDEITILTQWIRKGASFTLPVAELAPHDTLRMLAQAMFTAAETASYDFEAADAATVQKLNTVNRVVTEEALQSPALVVSFFNSQLYLPTQLEELKSVKKQIVSLDLSKMLVKDADMKLISEFENLRTLNLSFTGITGATLSELKKLKYLRSLSLSGTQVTAANLKSLAGFPALKTVYTWNSRVSTTDLAAIQKTSDKIRYQSGFRGDTLVLKLSLPVVENEALIITKPVPLQLRHYINGTQIRYTLDGTDPDSINSPLFKGTEMISGNTEVRAKAYKPGWISSDTLTVNFYSNAFHSDSVIFTSAPDPSYKGSATLLTDLIKGEANFRNGTWMGWRQNNMEALLSYSTPITVHSLTLSTIMDVSGYIMPPEFVEVWGGDEPGKLRLLGRTIPKQPTKVQPALLRGFEVSFPASTVKFLKVVAPPVRKLPSWHPGKGDKGWVFVDEILVN